jgi:signal transduction histidine kinase
MKRVEIDRARAEKRVINAIIMTEENERKRFANDLHDGLGPLLSTIKMSMSALGERIKDRPGNTILNNTNHLINEAINTIKDISNNLSPHVLSNFGLSSALSDFTMNINQTKVIEVEFKSNMDKYRLENEKEVVIYRAACELINNSIRHSGASRIEIDLNKHEKFITLQFNDNGRGFDTSALSNEDRKGMGLSNIDTRVKSIEGFILESNLGKAPGPYQIVNILKKNCIMDKSRIIIAEPSLFETLKDPAKRFSYLRLQASIKLLEYLKVIGTQKPCCLNGITCLKWTDLSNTKSLKICPSSDIIALSCRKEEYIIKG